MEDWTLLADDHALLRAQLARVIMMLSLVQSGSYTAQHLHDETVSQAEIWLSQQREHFAFEETSVFPQNERLAPTMAPRLARLQAEHRRLIDDFAALVTELTPPWSESHVSASLTVARLFEQQFEQHAVAESQLLDEVAVQVNQMKSPSPQRG
jgi:hemerythrin-like domain-containing protein